MKINVDKNCVKLHDNTTGVFRLHYVAIDSGLAMVRDYAGDKLYIPNNMTQEEMLKVVSFLMDVYKANTSLNKSDLLALSMGVNKLLKMYHFKPINKQDKSVYSELFTVGGDKCLFKSSGYYRYYFDWYIPNVEQSEIKEIYSRLGLEIPTFTKKDRVTKI